MRKYLIALIVLIILVFVSPTYAGTWSRGSSWNQGDLDMGGYSINGRDTSDTQDEDGLFFDPDSDGTNEIVFRSDGGIRLSEQSAPDTTPINTAVIWLRSSNGDLMVFWDTGDSEVLETHP